MRFEEILPLMREGKKARLEDDKDGEYWICGYSGFDESSKVLTIIRMDKNNCAPTTTYDWGIGRWMVMRDNWVAVE